MKVDGCIYRLNRSIVWLRNEKPPYPHGEQYAVFGRVVPRGKKPPSGAIDTGRHWLNIEPLAPEEPVFAVRIPCDGYSLTNLMYGGDGRKYLIKDGRCYSAPLRKALK